MILDALRKADAERERGSVPGLNAQPVPVPSGEARAPARSRPWFWGALGIAAGLVVAFAAVVALRGGPAAPVGGATAPVGGATAPVGGATAPAATAPAPSPLPLPASALTPAPAAPTDAASPAKAAVATARPAPTPAAPAPWPATPTRSTAGGADTTVASAPPRGRAEAASAAPTAGPAAGASAASGTGPSTGAPAVPAGPAGPASPATRLPARAEPATPPVVEAPIIAREQLPDPVRSELSALKLGGSIYSTRPSERSLIVNGQLCRENEVLAPGLTLEQIRPHSAVFRYKGYRFEQAL